MKNMRRNSLLTCIALSSLLLSHCQTAPTAVMPVTMEAASPIPQIVSPVPIDTQADFGFQTRQFDPAKPFFATMPYPDELTAVRETDLVPMRCSPEYFSWSGADHEYADPTTQERHKITDNLLQAYLKSAQALNPEGIITSISYCEIENGRSIVVYRVGPCGGGCAGIPHFSYGETDGSLELVATIQTGEDGAYFKCDPLQLTRSSILYVACSSEGMGIIRKINLLAQSVSIVLRCEVSESVVSCKSN